MRITIELPENPYVTSQEKGVSVINNKVHFYEKHKVATMRRLYAERISRYLRTYNLKAPAYDKPVRLEVIYTFKSSNRRLWGLFKATKPDCDNAVKLLQDVLADLGFFKNGDQQVAILAVSKFWGEKATVCIDIGEIV